MSDWKKLPFGIDFVVEQDLVPQGISKVKYSSGYSINCPFCAKLGLKPDRKHKYAIDIYKNVGHCFRCGSGHGMLSLHQALSKTPITLKEAEEDLLKRWNGLPSNVQIELAKVKEKLDEENKSKLEPAPIEIRDDVYNRFLDLLTLSKKHHDDLIARGLSEEEIIRGKYKTVPAGGFKTFAQRSTFNIAYDFSKHKKWGIPGFYGVGTSDVGVVALDNGYFVPVRDENGLISGMQIRFDPLPDNAPEYKKEHYAKYKWFTSNFKDKVKGCSASGCENIHYAGDWSKAPKQVILTEGVLKADVAAALSKRMTGKKAQPILGLVGVYNYERLSDELAKLKCLKGLEKVVLAVDMDYREKPQVAQAMNNIIEIIKKYNLECEVFKWDPQYKGIDDYFLAIVKKRADVAN